MVTETKALLNDETIRKVQKLIRANIDSYDGLRECADQVNEEPISALFRELAAQRSAMATELQNYVEWNGAEAEDDGSFAASVHRAWISVRGKLNGGDPYVILIEAERGEDSIKDAYEDVLKQTSGTALNDVLQMQYAHIKAAHDGVRDLRDVYRNKS